MYHRPVNTAAQPEIVYAIPEGDRQAVPAATLMAMGRLVDYLERAQARELRRFEKCLVTRKPGNIGMGWAAVRAAAPKVAPLVPA